MAEKEERISIELLKDDFCASCDNRGKLKNCCCYEKQEYDERYQKSLSCQEAISKMAKAIFKLDNVLALDIEFEQLKKQKQFSYKVFAEAALNALLNNEK